MTPRKINLQNVSKNAPFLSLIGVEGARDSRKGTPSHHPEPKREEGDSMLRRMVMVKIGARLAVLLLAGGGWAPSVAQHQRRCCTAAKKTAANMCKIST